MKRDHIDFQDRSTPLAYLITIRTYGTWLHGDNRGSMDRREYNVYGAAKIAPSERAQERDRKLMKSMPYEMDARARSAVNTAIRGVCAYRAYSLFAANVRTTHAHIVASASDRPELMMNSFKAYSTRELRKMGLIDHGQKVWARHGSTRYLWTQQHVEAAVEYVLYDQGGELPAFD